MQRLTFITALIIAMICSACATEDTSIPATPTLEYVPIAVVADTDDTRLAVDGNTTVWQVGDRLTLCFISGYSSAAYATLAIESPSDISHDGKSATFRGSAPQGTYYGITALYPAVESPSANILLDRKAPDNIFLSSFQSYEYNPITIGTNTRIPIALSHLMHKVDFNIALADGFLSDALDANSIAIEMSATANGQTVAFSDTAALNIRSNSLTTRTTTESITAYGSGSTISTMLFPMNTMRNVALTISIYVDGTLRHVVHKPESGTLQSLKMSPGKSTTINITLSDKNSVGGGGEIVQKPITLHTTATRIKANGVESATLRVTEEDGTDVTTECSLHLTTGTRLQSTTFLTTTPGTYTIYAERHGMRSNEITITAEEVTNTGKRVVFAEGVTLTSGWYDTNKRGNGQTHGDIMMCWAASAANIIEWWQDRYQAAGKSLPQGATTGPGEVYELKTMELFKEQWTTLERGAQVFQAVTWYFEGTNLCKDASPGTSAQPVGAGGYYSSLMTDLRAHMYCGYDYLYFTDLYSGEINNYYKWGGGSGLTGTDRLKAFSDIVVDVMGKGVASMAVALSANLASGHHATTLWGYEIDNATGLITRLWITDSDDLVKDPKEQLLNEYSVSMSSAGTIELKGNTRYQLWVVGLQPMSGYQR